VRLFGCVIAVAVLRETRATKAAANEKYILRDSIDEFS
jgi:hypothetical protein